MLFCTSKSTIVFGFDLDRWKNKKAMYKDEIPFVSTVSTESVMLWGFATNVTSDSFTVSKVWFEKIIDMYKEQDKCNM